MSIRCWSIFAWGESTLHINQKSSSLERNFFCSWRQQFPVQILSFWYLVSGLALILLRKFTFTFFLSGSGLQIHRAHRKLISFLWVHCYELVSAFCNYCESLLQILQLLWALVHYRAISKKFVLKLENGSLATTSVAVTRRNSGRWSFLGRSSSRVRRPQQIHSSVTFS